MTAPDRRVQANAGALSRVGDDDMIADYLPDAQALLCRVEVEGFSLLAAPYDGTDIRAHALKAAGHSEVVFGDESQVLGGVLLPYHVVLSGEDDSVGFWRAEWMSDGIMIGLSTRYASDSAPDNAEQMAADWLERLVPLTLDNIAAITPADIPTD